MGIEIWYYKHQGRKIGPFSHEKIHEMLETGEIQPTTEIWEEKTSVWVPIMEAPQFNMASLDETPTITVEKGTFYSRETDDAYVQPRPWVRFWARMIDYSLVFLLISIILLVLHVNWIPMRPYLGMGGIFLFMFIEPFLLSTWGSTPGKWVLKVTVRDESHRKLTYSRGLRRSFSLWWRGMGAGIPVVSLITMMIAAIKLSATGATTWDQLNHSIVFHGIIGKKRIFLVILYFILYFWLLSVIA